MFSSSEDVFYGQSWLWVCKAEGHFLFPFATPALCTSSQPAASQGEGKGASLGSPQVYGLQPVQAQRALTLEVLPGW